MPTRSRAVKGMTGLLLAATLVGGLAACEEEGPAEEMGEAADEAAEETGEAVDEAGDEMQEQAE